MSEQEWDDIDGGWDDVDVAAGKRRKTRARGNRGKRRATAQTAPATSPAAKPKQQRRPKDHRPNPTKEPKAAPQKASRPWLLPMVVFAVAVGGFVLILMASK